MLEHLGWKEAADLIIGIRGKNDFFQSRYL